jgi:DnaJ-class molecular chaperone
MRDPYEVLGVGRQASETDVKKAYRRLAKQHHPDQNKDNPKAKDRFAEINGAYEILGDKDKRAKFDRGEIDADGKPRFHGFEGGDGFAGFNRGGGAGGFRQSGPGAGVFDDFLSDILGQAFSGGGRAGAAGNTGFARGPRPGQGPGGMGAGMGGGAARGEDVTVSVLVAPEEIVKGEKVRVSLPDGRTLDVALPEGVTDGQQIRLKGQGGGHGAQRGDVMVTVKLRRDGTFRPEGADLHADLAISLEDAVLGGKVRAATPDGSVDLNIPAGTTGGKPLRLRGRGLPVKGGGRGDLYITPRIVLPEGGDAELTGFLTARRRR